MLENLSANSPRWPFFLVFALLLIASLVSFALLRTIPQFGGGETWREAKHMRLAFLPGVLNIVLLVWFFSGSLPARQAGGLAGIMGAPQFDLPQAALAYYSTVPGAEVQVGNAPCTVSVFLLPWLVPSMVILWTSCVIIGTVALRKLSQ